MEVEVRESCGDCAAKGGGETMGGEKMEDDVFRAGGVLNDGEYTGDRATEIGGI